jgi:hypothetical protein
VRGTGRKGRLATIVRDLDIPRPFDLGDFVARLEHQRNRPIVLRPFRAGPGVPCGLLIATADADYVFHEQGTTPFHATHIKLHELAHILLDHRNGTVVWTKLVNLLVPDVDPELVQLILSRTAYSTAEEREAETLASLILEETGDPPRPAPVTGPETGSFLDRLERAWGRGSSASQAA